MTRLYTLTVYLDSERVGYGTVLEDHTVDQLIARANEWVGLHSWNRLELLPYAHAPLPL
jgi:hypothetical protein